jgi:hypothetical protein
MIDTTRTIEVERAPGELLLLVVIGVLLTAGAGYLAFGLPAGAAFARLLGLAGLVLFGFSTLIAIWQFLSQTGTAITISPEGIRDTRIAAETIPWSAVTDVSTLNYRYQKTVALSVNPATEARLTLSFPLRYTRAINRAFGYSEISISATGAATDFETLMANVTAYWRAWRGPQ